jgi:hypothetical protein
MIGVDIGAARGGKWAASEKTPRLQHATRAHDLLFWLMFFL